jgi:hypothetical protein
MLGDTIQPQIRRESEFGGKKLLPLHREFTKNLNSFASGSEWIQIVGSAESLELIPAWRAVW